MARKTATKPKTQRKPRSRGRPSAWTRANRKAVLEAIEQGHDYKSAAAAAGISQSTFHKWTALGRAGEAEYAEFVEQVAEAERRFLSRLKSTAWTALHDVARNSDSAGARVQAAKVILDRIEGQAVQRTELSGPQGRPLEVAQRPPLFDAETLRQAWETPEGQAMVMAMVSQLHEQPAEAK